MIVTDHYQCFRRTIIRSSWGLYLAVISKFIITKIKNLQSVVSYTVLILQKIWSFFYTTIRVGSLHIKGIERGRGGVFFLLLSR